MLDTFRTAATVVVAALLAAGASAQTLSVTYDLHQVMLDPTAYGGPQPLTGSFVWTYQSGDFENGSGAFTSLDVPWSAEGLATLNTTIETKSIEIVLPGNYHDKGVDISLKLVQPLTPDGPSAINLVLSKFEVQQGVVHQGTIASGEIAPQGTLPTGYGVGTPGTGAFVPTLHQTGGLAHLGSTTFAVASHDLLGGASCFVLVGFGQVSVPVLGIDLLVNPAAMLTFAGQADGAAGIAGAGSLVTPLPIPSDPAFVGLELDLQLVALDAGSPGGLLAASAGLSTQVFP